MAASKSYFPRQSYRFLSSETSFASHHDSAFELDESDIYNSGPAEFRKTSVSSGRLATKKGAGGAGSGRRGGGGGGGGDGVVVGGTPTSLPVNIPDWSKILKDEYRGIRRRDCVNDDDDDDVDGEDCLGGGGVRVPPHEFLARQMARTRIASFSVHEGVGRTLKGRDLSRVRNAIWEKTGFED